MLASVSLCVDKALFDVTVHYLNPFGKVLDSCAEAPAYLIDLMHDKNAEIRKVCDNTLDIIAVSWSSSVFPLTASFAFSVHWSLDGGFPLQDRFLLPIPSAPAGCKIQQHRTT